jgi:hypothetical protein
VTLVTSHLNETIRITAAAAAAAAAAATAERHTKRDVDNLSSVFLAHSPAHTHTVTYDIRCTTLMIDEEK